MNGSFCRAVTCFLVLAGWGRLEAQESCLDGRYQFTTKALEKNVELIDKCLAFSRGEVLDECIDWGGEKYCWAPAKVGWHRWTSGMATQLQRKKKTIQGRFCIVVDKAGYEMTLYEGGKRVETWPMDLGDNPFDDRVAGGRECTPEGLFALEYKGWTRYHEALLIAHPNVGAKKRHRQLRKKGAIDHGIGQWLEIHGNDWPEERSNWTDGCVALADEFMDQLYQHMGLPPRKALEKAKGKNRRKLRKAVARVERQTVLAIVKYAHPESEYCTR